MRLKLRILPLFILLTLMLCACAGLPDSVTILEGTPLSAKEAEAVHIALSENSVLTENSQSANQKEDNTLITNPTPSGETTPVPEVSPSPEITPAPATAPSETVTPAPTQAPAPTTAPKPIAPKDSTPVGIHGALRVDGSSLVDQNGDPFQLYGMSTHGIGWFPQYVNKDSFRTLRDDWNTNCVRIAMYTAEYNGYCTGGNKDDLKTLVQNGVDYATDLGMYVIIDWHILQDQDPNVYKSDAIDFFQEMSSTYADYDNVLYEICNEPNGYATWSSVKSYAEEVIPVIRENDSDAIILVGSPTWSQNIDQAASDPLDYDNIMYTLHFYAGTHKDDLRNRLDTCVSNGLPVFISEFGICDASGNGALDYDSAGKWMELIEKHNVSFFCWNLANKSESSSVFKANSSRTSDWTEDDLNESGKWFRDYCRSK